MLIKIRDGASEIATQDCRILNAPDGRPCAVWRGLAFPLLAPEDAIDLAGEAFPPGLCGAPREVEPASRWTIVRGDAETYVLLAGSRETLDGVVRALTGDGVEVVRTGRYLGEAAEADWFVRLARERDQDVLACLERTLGSPEADRPGDLRAEVLRAEVVSAHAREAQIRAERDLLRRDLVARLSADSMALEAVRDDLERERAARVDAEAALAENAARIERARVDPSTEPAPRTRSARVVEREMEAALTALLPRARLLRDTLTVVAIEFADRRGVYAALRELQASERGVPSAWKTLRGLDGWIERHVSNGQDDSGRAYARLDPSDRTWQVLVSHKGQQARDIDWLARC